MQRRCGAGAALGAAQCNYTQTAAVPQHHCTACCCKPHAAAGNAGRRPRQLWLPLHCDHCLTCAHSFTVPQAAGGGGKPPGPASKGGPQQQRKGGPAAAAGGGEEEASDVSDSSEDDDEEDLPDDTDKVGRGAVVTSELM